MSDSVRAGEVEKFDALAAEWWNPAGPMRALHAMNPLRVGWIARRLRARGVAGRVLDVGCGAGLAAEAMAARGFDVLGIDAAAEVVAVARAHAAGRGLALEYRAGTADGLEERFGAVLALEVIEHVADPAAFMGTLAGLVAPGGMVFVSTINRTVRSLAVAKVGAEYVLGMLPRGTHEWGRFVRPGELEGWGRRVGLRRMGVGGMVYDVVGGGWRMGGDLGVNYIMALGR